MFQKGSHYMMAPFFYAQGISRSGPCPAVKNPCSRHPFLHWTSEIKSLTPAIEFPAVFNGSPN